MLRRHSFWVFEAEFTHMSEVEMANRSNEKDVASDKMLPSIVATVSSVAHPPIGVRAATNAGVIDQTNLYTEAINQARPISPPGGEALRLSKVIREGTARTSGLTPATAERMAVSGRSVDSLINGANPIGKAAEVVAISDYRALHVGQKPGIINSPEHVARNVQDIRLAPDDASRKDLIFAFKTKSGEVLWKYNGQVKTGGARYVSDELIKMAKTPGYGKVGYVDARYVNSDGTPRVAPGAFTSSQARRLQKTKVRLRGIPNLEKRADQLIASIKAGKLDGLDPSARHELKQLRDDINMAYRARGVVSRIGGGAAIAAASAAVVSLFVQLATEGKVDVQTVAKSAGAGAIFGAAGTGADAGLHHLGTKFLEMTPEAAKEFARQGVSVGLCLLAISTDLAFEIHAARCGGVSLMDAVGGTATKTALDLLPLVMGSLGLVGLPILVGVQVGGRWLLGKARETDRILEQATKADVSLAESISSRIAVFSETVASVTAECAETDALFREAMRHSVPPVRPTLHMVKP